MNHNNLKNMVFKVEKHEGVNIQGEDNDPTEDDNHALENTIEDDGINTLIHDTFSPSISDHDDDDSLESSIYLYLRRHTSPYTKNSKQLFSLLYCCC